MGHGTFCRKNTYGLRSSRNDPTALGVEVGFLPGPEYGKALPPPKDLNQIQSPRGVQKLLVFLALGFKRFVLGGFKNTKGMLSA